jgi:uncharacterized RDD family membrane protein YckC
MSDLNPYAAPAVEDSVAVPADGPLELRYASRLRRFLNLIIDYVVVQLLIGTLMILLLLFGTQVRGRLVSTAISVSVWFCYYLICEALLGATVAKFITGTRVVDDEGNHPSFGQVLGRTFARMVPFEWFSFFDTPPVGWHDDWSNTRVVLIRR